jgi:hypothetical protein
LKISFLKGKEEIVVVGGRLKSTVDSRGAVGRELNKPRPSVARFVYTHSTHTHTYTHIAAISELFFFFSEEKIK